MRIRLPSKSVFSALVIAALSAQTLSYAYRVKPHDTLSSIAQQFYSGSIYGPRGSLEKLQALNPKIQNPNFILPADQIITPAEEVRPPAEETIIPIATATPPSLSATEVKENSRSLFSYALSPSYGVRAISTQDLQTGKSGNLNSSLNLDLEATCYQNWSPSFQTFARAGFGYTSFEATADAMKTLSNTSQWLGHFGFGAHQIISSNTSIEIAADDHSQFFSKTISTTNIKVDQTMVPQIGILVSHDFISLSPKNTLGAAVGYARLFSANGDGYDVKGGNGFEGLIYWKMKNSAHTLSQLELGVSQRAQNTSLTDQTETIAMLRFRYFFDQDFFTPKEVQ